MNTIFITYILIVNILGYFLMFLDKQKAKKHKWRIPENTLMLVAIIGGSIGSIIGMQTFRHKTKHIKFKFGIPIILILQVILFFLFFK
ncbi:hypothetical protein UT300003_19190 [Clostridium sardiniense]|uniref:DUF1294 domain-containing protein n=1 Tax=Clostridium sardiniense TaxID=29369 RepID=UPI001A9CA9A7|nr:DUF1294 domain-containing protein [Clostridium sardiniense]MBM7833771.1 uncharacterized membrane protein YsdA (DUF1294 family) [Clostridium sardiniense]